MGCNCGKNKPPAGATNRNQPEQGGGHGAKVTPASAAPAGVSTPVQPAAQQSFAVTTTDGRTSTWGSKLEADAERVRRGGGSVRPVR